jgi:hypothetical protein
MVFLARLVQWLSLTHSLTGEIVGYNQDVYICTWLAYSQFKTDENLSCDAAHVVVLLHGF